MKNAIVTFLLPGNNWSGGVRVTSLMGNLLIDRGHRVRIVHPRRPINPLFYLFSPFLRLKLGLAKPYHKGWLDTFSGLIEQYTEINELKFE
jgi:hypothetical protein